MTATDVYGLASADASHLWLAGGGGAILFTADGAVDLPVTPPASLPRKGGPTLSDLTD